MTETEATGDALPRVMRCQDLRKCRCSQMGNGFAKRERKKYNNNEEKIYNINRKLIEWKNPFATPLGGLKA